MQHISHTPCDGSTTNTTPSFGTPAHGSPIRTTFPSEIGDGDGYPIPESRVLIIMTGNINPLSLMFPLSFCTRLFCIELGGIEANNQKKKKKTENFDFVVLLVLVTEI
jgi:hypothetical protein